MAFRIKNNTQGRIVVNSIKATLSPSGCSGDSVVCDDVHRGDSDLLELSSMNAVSFLPLETRPAAKTAQAKAKKTKKTQTKRRRPAGSVVYVDEGKVKTKKMVNSVEQDGQRPDPRFIDAEGQDKEKGSPFIEV